MDTNARVGTAVAAGYILGRFKKLRLALLVAPALASKDVRKTAGGLLQNPAGSLAGMAGSRLVSVGRTAAVSAASDRLERLSDRLAERTQSLNQRDGRSTEPEDEADTEDDLDEPEDETEYDETEDLDEAEYDEADEADEADEPEDEAEEDEYEDLDEAEGDDYQDAEEPDSGDERGGSNGSTHHQVARRTRAKAPARAGRE
jgi:hypothetical protein